MEQWNTIKTSLFDLHLKGQRSKQGHGLVQDTARFISVSDLVLPFVLLHGMDDAHL